jgi:carboxypeptidase C (cathepsin A)
VINSSTQYLRTIAALAFVLGTVPVPGQAPHVENVVATRHQAIVAGKTVQYTATAGLLPIYVNDTGEQMASMFFIAYTIERPQGQPPRPITFLWNGGPGSNSAQIHVVGFGPKRVKTADTYPAWGPNTETEMVDNQETWLDTSDLVFVDPVGTGFSRATKQEYRDILYTPRGDAEAVAELIRLYRTRFDAWDAPIFLAGESYGTTRAMMVAEALERRRTRLAGVVLMSGGFNVGQSVPRSLNQALAISEYTAGAHYHKRLSPELQALSRDAAVSRAVEWARGEYAPALERLESLPPSERAALLAQLQRYTGIDPRYVDEKTLTISGAEFADRLMQDRGLELGRYDVRMTTTSRKPETAWLPLTDPSLTPMIDLMQGTSRLFNHYVRETLGFKSDLLYRGPFGEAFHPEPLITVGPGFQSDWMTNMWNRGGGAAEGRAGGAGTAGRGGGAGGRGGAEAGGEEQPPLRRAMDVNPKLRVMNMKGMYDGSCATMDEAVARAESHLKGRITNHCYVGGHMFYSDLEARREAKRHFAEFVREVLAAREPSLP